MLKNVKIQISSSSMHSLFATWSCSSEFKDETSHFSTVQLHMLHIFPHLLLRAVDLGVKFPMEITRRPSSFNILQIYIKVLFSQKTIWTTIGSKRFNNGWNNSLKNNWNLPKLIISNSTCIAGFNNQTQSCKPSTLKLKIWKETKRTISKFFKQLLLFLPKYQRRTGPNLLSIHIPSVMLGSRNDAGTS